jgi:glycosyltransferase involved in cell wall biosynthesis
MPSCPQQAAAPTSFELPPPADERPTLVHLTASPCFGGPERQMLELGCELASSYRSVYLTFREEERCWGFVDNGRKRGFEVIALQNDTPRLLAVFNELKSHLRNLNASVLICDGYKAGILGRPAARALGIPVIATSRGWTGESIRVRVFEWLDRLNLRWMDKVVCVSEAQAQKVRKAGVPGEKVAVIHNAIRTERFAAPPDPAYRQKLEALFTAPPTHILGAAGRLSPEKGFDVLIEACRRLAAENKLDFAVALFGEGALRAPLQQQIDAAGLAGRVVLAGFTPELDRYMPHFDVFVQSSHTEGLPNVLLEAAAAAVPVVATNVGGTAEVVADARTGLLVPPANPADLAGAIARLLQNDDLRNRMKAAAPGYVAHHFSFTHQADQYRNLLAHHLKLV